MNGPNIPRATDAEVKDLAVLVPTLMEIVKSKPEALTFTLSRDVLMALLVQTDAKVKRLARYDGVRQMLYDTLGDGESVGHMGFVKVSAYREILKRMDGEG